MDAICIQQSIRTHLLSTLLSTQRLKLGKFSTVHLLILYKFHDKREKQASLMEVLAAAVLVHDLHMHELIPQPEREMLCRTDYMLYMQQTEKYAQ